MELILIKPKKTSKCKICRAEYVKRSISHKTCSVSCAIEIVIRDKKHKEAKIDKARKEALKKPAEYADEAQSAVNRYVNKRDEHLPCICCGKSPYEGVRHAGHFKSRGSNSFLRFNLWNINTCCYSCNVKKGGNINEYRPALIEKIGIEKVEYLDNAPRSKVYSKEYLMRLKSIFNKKLKRLKND